MSKNTTQLWNTKNRKVAPQNKTGLHWVMSKAKDILSMRVSDILIKDKGDVTKRFLSIMLSWKIQKSSAQSNDAFMRKTTNAKDEWSFYMRDFKDRDCLKSMYESENVSFWTNGGNFWHYRLETTYQWRRLMVIFYNSADYHGVKISFDELLEKNEPMRVSFF